jgi:hypothetical protein
MTRALVLTLAFFVSLGCRETRPVPSAGRPALAESDSAGGVAKKDTKRKKQEQEPGEASEQVRHPPGRLVTFTGACDASGAVALDDRRFLVADDEDNVLRVYDADRGGPPERMFDIGAELALAEPDAEADLEAAARIGNRAFFLSSHARKRSGKVDPNRFVFFGVDLTPSGDRVTLAGRPASTLLDELARLPSTESLGLHSGRLRAPVSEGAVNIEGMTAAPGGGLYIGFRNPLPQGKAILVRLSNPNDVLEGRPASFDEPRLLDLGGLGIRSLSSHHGKFFLIAGPALGEGLFRVARFDERGAVHFLPGIEFEGFSPEGMFTPESRDEVLLLSDDGTRMLGTKTCKKIKDASEKSFRGQWLRLPD